MPHNITEVTKFQIISLWEIYPSAELRTGMPAAWIFCRSFRIGRLSGIFLKNFRQSFCFCHPACREWS